MPRLFGRGAAAEERTTRIAAPPKWMRPDAPPPRLSELIAHGWVPHVIERQDHRTGDTIVTETRYRILTNRRGTKTYVQWGNESAPVEPALTRTGGEETVRPLGTVRRARHGSGQFPPAVGADEVRVVEPDPRGGWGPGYHPTIESGPERAVPVEDFGG